MGQEDLFEVARKGVAQTIPGPYAPFFIARHARRFVDPRGSFFLGKANQDADTLVTSRGSFPHRILEGEEAGTSKLLILEHRCRVGIARSFIPKMAILFLAALHPRSDHVQAPCNWSANSSIGTGYAFDDECSGCDDEFGFNIGRPWLSPSCHRRGARGLRERRTTPGIQRRGLYVPAIKLAAVNPPIWLVSTPENRSRDESEPLASSHRDTELLHELGEGFSDCCLKS
jgi:hypothetical protein